MNAKIGFAQALSIFCLLLLLMIGMGVFYVVQETEQVIVTQFGKPVGQPIREAGLKWKIPFIQQVNRIEKRVLEWDGPSTQMPTRDKLYIYVDVFGRWQISDPLQYFLRLRDERSAQSRLNDILGSETRNTVARHDLVEIVRTTRKREAALEVTQDGSIPSAQLPPIARGRVELEEEIYKAAKVKLAEFGIDLLDIRFKRINYNTDVAKNIFTRMISERQQIAERFRSEGAGEAAKILGQMQKEMQSIQSEAYRQVKTIRGKADAEATDIYAGAYNQTAEAREFYSLLRSLEVCENAFDKDTTAIFTTDSDLLKYLKSAK